MFAALRKLALRRRRFRLQGVLIVTQVAAAFLPASAALRVDPAATLRHD